MPESWDTSTIGTYGSESRRTCHRAKRLATHIATAILGLTTTALMSGGLHYDNLLQETPNLVGGTKVAAAAIGWSAMSTAIMPGIQAAAKWPGRGMTGAMAATGTAAAVGTALTAVAANIEAQYTPEAVVTELNRHMAAYGSSPEIARQIDNLQRMYACCGSEGPDTYERARDHITGEVPMSCCAEQKNTCDRLDTVQLNQEGCAQPLSDEISASLQVLTALLIAQTGALALATAAATVASIGRRNTGA